MLDVVLKYVCYRFKCFFFFVNQVAFYGVPGHGPSLCLEKREVRACWMEAVPSMIPTKQVTTSTWQWVQ